MTKQVDVKELFERYRKEGIEVLGLKLIPDKWEREKREAHSKFRELFKEVEAMDKNSFVSFLYFEDNKAWTGPQRMGIKATEDFDRFKMAMKKLLDESESIEKRLNEVVEREGAHHVRGFGIALSSAILHVYDPEKYGVLNNAVWGALEKIGRLPDWKPWSGWGNYYVKVNEVLKNLAGELETDLVGVDGFMYYLKGLEITPEKEIIRPEIIPLEEKVLMPILARNISKYFPDLEIFVDEEGREGVKYPMGEAGEADIVCIDKNGDYTIIEFKKGLTGDTVVSQILRYIGWVQENLCDKGQTVGGIIIVGELSEKLQILIKKY